MTDQKISSSATILCASCGIEVDLHDGEQDTGLCQECEDRISAAPVSWPSATSNKQNSYEY